jgi:hypothetical protein
LNQVSGVLQQASRTPPELELMEELLDVEDEAGRRQWLEAHREDITPEFMDMMTAVMSQSQSNDDPELNQRMQETYAAVIKFSMESNLQK